MPKKQKKQPQAIQAQTMETQSSARSLATSVWLPSLLSCLVLLAAYPPLQVYPLAWIAPVGWLLVCERSLPVGRKGYFHLWLSGCLFWLVSLHSIRLAFWVLYFGWLAMSLYLAIYIPLMVAVTRFMVHRWRVPLVVAAPVVWTGLELIRATLLTGYAATTLAHSQAWQPLVIQVADMLGHGGLSSLMIMFAAAALQVGRQLTRGFTTGNTTRSESLDPASIAKSPSLLPIVGSAVAVLLIPTSVLAYGFWRIEQADRQLASNPVLLRCLLLQENTPTVFEMNVDLAAYNKSTETAWTRYARLCQAAAQQHAQLDLVVWPESTFTASEPYFDIEYDGDRLPGSLERVLREFNLNRSEFDMNLQLSQQQFGLKVKVALLASRGLEPYAELPAQDGPELLVGCEHVRYGAEKSQHSGAIWIGANGAVKGTYDKMHLVMFGEYIPLRPLLGWLEGVFGFAGADPGDKPQAFAVNGVQVAPNICFETMVPRLICWQVKQLKAQGKNPQLLVNLTNDSWFKGTSMLDHHLASSIICCVENRRPLLVAANTGLSAEIDGSGRLLQCTQRLTAQAVLAEPRADGRWGLVQVVGYPLSWLCAGITVLAAVALAVDARPYGSRPLPLAEEITAVTR